MKRSNEFAVGLAVLAALALVIGGALWLSETDVNQKQASYKARFRTVGGLGVGAPVTLRGVRIGRVEGIRLVKNEWVEADLSIDRSVELREVSDYAAHYSSTGIFSRSNRRPECSRWSGARFSRGFTISFTSAIAITGNCLMNSRNHMLNQPKLPARIA